MLTLDHVGYVGRDLAAMRRRALALGLAPTEPKVLQAQDATTGVARSLQQDSCHIVLQSGYIELTAVTTDDPRHHLAAWRRPQDGVRILALGAEDASAAREHCVAAGVAVTPVARASRAIEYGRRRGEAQFDWFMLEARESPQALLCVVTNLRPELVYQDEVTSHPLGALALAEVVLVLNDPDKYQARHGSWLGTGWITDDDARVLPLASGSLRLMSPEAAAIRYADLLPRLDPSAAGGVAAVVLRVADLSRARAVLEHNGLRVRTLGRDLAVGAEQALGAALILRA